MNNKKVSVLFTRQHSFSCNIIYMITGRRYTHAAISLDSDYKRFYSFCFKGFCEEHPHHRHLFQGKKESLCLDLEIDESEFNIINKEMNVIKQNSCCKYNYLGFVMSLFHLLIKRNNSYFCSQMVAALLKKTKSVQLDKEDSFYLPNRLLNELENHSALTQKLINRI